MISHADTVKAIQDDHTDLIKKAFKQMESPTLELLHAAVGISGEAGELLDAIKKHWAYKKPLDLQNVIEELGDLEFYMGAMRLALDLSREEILLHNIKKLEKRYPGRIYSNAAAVERADKTPPSQPPQG